MDIQIKTFREVGQVAEGIYNSILPIEELDGKKFVLSIGADRYYIPSTLKRQIKKKATEGQPMKIRFRGLSATGRLMFDVQSGDVSAPVRKKAPKKKKEIEEV